MRKHEAVARLFFFCAACAACVVWIAVFVIAGIGLPDPHLGMVLMLAFSGLGLLLPWLAIAIAMSRQIGWNDDLTGTPDTRP